LTDEEWNFIYNPVKRYAIQQMNRYKSDKARRVYMDVLEENICKQWNMYTFTTTEQLRADAMRWVKWSHCNTNRILNKDKYAVSFNDLGDDEDDAYDVEHITYPDELPLDEIDRYTYGFNKTEMKIINILKNEKGTKKVIDMAKELGFSIQYFYCIAARMKVKIRRNMKSQEM